MGAKRISLMAPYMRPLTDLVVTTSSTKALR